MTLLPAGYINGGLGIIAAFLAALVHFCLLLPAALLYKRRGARRSPGAAADLIMLILLLLTLISTALTFARASSVFFQGRLYPQAALLCALLAAVYAATRYPAVIGRTAVMISALLILLTLFLAAGAVPLAKPLNFHAAVTRPVRRLFLSGGVEALDPGCLLVFLILAPAVKKGSPLRSAAIYTALRLAVAAVVMLLITAVLGDAADSTPYPALTLARCSGGSLMERRDALYLFIWTTLALMRMAALLHCCGVIIARRGRTFTRFSGTVLCALVCCFAVTALLVSGSELKLTYTLTQVLAALAAALVPPIIAFRRKENAG